MGFSNRWREAMFEPETRDVLVAFKDDPEYVFQATVQLSLDVTEDDEDIFFYFNGEEELLDAVEKEYDTVHEFVILDIVE